MTVRNYLPLPGCIVSNSQIPRIDGTNSRRVAVNSNNSNNRHSKVNNSNFLPSLKVTNNKACHSSMLRIWLNLIFRCTRHLVLGFHHIVKHISVDSVLRWLKRYLEKPSKILNSNKKEYSRIEYQVQNSPEQQQQLAQYIPNKKFVPANSSVVAEKTI